MYLLTKKQGQIDSGVYASVDDDGTSVIQFFVDKDDAIMYNTMLEALDQNICITEIDEDMIEKFCSVMGHAYSVVDEGEFVIPKLETLEHVILNRDPLS
tara:strand:- start:414 stop:710 length:297 start_codon:yes stop_codon:yes gene_type:complete